jgi:IS1 family transposase
MAAPEGDVIEFDELCLRQSPPLWLWLGVSRLTRQVLGLALGERTDETLAEAWAQVPADYQSRPVYTDHWGAYARLLPASQHHPCDKGSGLTSIVESLNTKWRQRQSGLVRRSCGVHPKIATDLSERFYILVDEHNRQSARRWKRRQEEEATTQSNP